MSIERETVCANTTAYTQSSTHSKITQWETIHARLDTQARYDKSTFIIRELLIVPFEEEVPEPDIGYVDLWIARLSRHDEG